MNNPRGREVEKSVSDSLRKGESNKELIFKYDTGRGLMYQYTGRDYEWIKLDISKTIGIPLREKWNFNQANVIWRAYSVSDWLNDPPYDRY